MSRIGNKPITIPPGVQVTAAGSNVVVRGQKGELKVLVPQGISAAIKVRAIAISRKNDQPALRALHGLVRALVANAVNGVSQGFEKRLDLKGVGFRAEVQTNQLILHVGFSHPVAMEIPQDITLTVEKNQIIVSGIDRQRVGQIAATIRAVRPPEPYKGKGIRYADEVVKLKPGKQAAKTQGA